MELEKFKELLAKPEDLQKGIVAEKIATVKPEDIAKQYDPKQHAINDPAKRPDKTVKLDDGSSRLVTVTRLPISMQKRIVRLAATFLCGRPIELMANAVEQIDKDLLVVITKTWKDNKLDYKSKKLAKLMMSETECAELWYAEPIEEGFWKGTPNDKPNVKFKLRMKILAYSLGDSLYPVYNAAGDMIAFGRGYTVAADGAKLERFDIYTAENIYYLKKDSSGWMQEKAETNPYKKIPIIYYNQPVPEWHDVQELIERKEKAMSSLGDINEYHAAPTLVSKNAEIVGFAQKGEEGKIIEITGDKADLNYVSWDKSPESQKLEFELLDREIYGLTDTPNISFEQMKGLGTFSGIALKMLFLGAHMKASDHEENFGESIQRRINYIVAAMTIINVAFEGAKNLTIEPKFTYFLPKNEQEIIEMLSTATTGGIMSKETAVRNNPLVQDPEAEVELIKAEADAASALDQQFS